MKFKPGLIGGSFSGSVGNITASRNRFGSYLRDRAMPINPNSSRQQAVRSRFQSLAFSWGNDLTQAQRDAWILYGQNVTSKDKNGDDINLTGYNHFQRTNSIVLAGSFPQVDDGPTIFTVAEADPTLAAVVDEAGQEISVTFDNTLGWANEDDAGMQIAMTRPASPGVNFIPPIFRVAGFIDGDSITPPTSPTVFPVPFAVSEDQKVIVQARSVRADGRLSDPFRSTTAVTA